MFVNVSKEKITSDFHHRNVPLSSELAPEHTGKTDAVTLWGWVREQKHPESVRN